MAEKDDLKDPKDDEQNEPEKKYSQDDVNKMMSAKANEVTKKLTEDFEKKFADMNASIDEKVKEAQKHGEELAKMDAKQREEAEQAQRDKEAKEREAQIAEREEKLNQRYALADAKEKLADSGLSSLAKFVTSTDDETQSANISELQSWLKEHDAKVRDDALKGGSNPNSGDNNQGSTDDGDMTLEKWQKLSASEKSTYWHANPEHAAELNKQNQHF